MDKEKVYQRSKELLQEKYNFHYNQGFNLFTEDNDEKNSCYFGGNGDYIDIYTDISWTLDDEGLEYDGDIIDLIEKEFKESWEKGTWVWK